MIMYNRPDKVRALIEALRKVKPPVVYVIADGPKPDKENDMSRCEECRQILSHIDWPCKLHKNFAEENLGLKNRVVSGLDWVFEHEEQAIILEDDCIPAVDFFPFCEDLLVRYKDDDRIGMISGNNFDTKPFLSDDSYRYTIYPHIWGWATWRRVWQKYDVDMKDISQLNREMFLRQFFSKASTRRYWHDIFKFCQSSKSRSWAYPFTFFCWSQNYLSIVPCVNLVSNIGFDSDGTHTTGNKNSPLANMAQGQMHFPLEHPPLLCRDINLDEKVQAFNYENCYTFKQKIKYYILFGLSILGLKEFVLNLKGTLLASKRR